MGDNSFLDKKTRQGLIYGSLIAAGIGAATGTNTRDAILKAAQAGSTAYTGGMNQLYNQRQEELQQERIAEMTKASQLHSALEQRKFEQEQQELPARLKYLESQSAYQGILGKEKEQEMAFTEILKQAVEADKGLDPMQKAMIMSNPQAAQSYFESKYGYDKSSTKWHQYQFPNGKYAGSFDLNNPTDRETIKRMGLIPYATPSTRMSPAEAQAQAKATTTGTLEAQTEYFAEHPEAMDIVEKDPIRKITRRALQKRGLGYIDLGTPEREK